MALMLLKVKTKMFFPRWKQVPRKSSPCLARVHFELLLIENIRPAELGLVVQN